MKNKAEEAAQTASDKLSKFQQVTAEDVQIQANKL